MKAPAQFVDQRQVRRNFARAASTYDQVAVLQREVGSRMLERLDYVRIEPQRVLDLGCGTGASLTALHERYPKAAVIGVDLSERCCARAGTALTLALACCRFCAAGGAAAGGGCGLPALQAAVDRSALVEPDAALA
jgi:ubiquinone/menaquinone biosynthesis C-methylase UbiE